MSRIIFKIENDTAEIIDSDFNEPYIKVTTENGVPVVFLSIPQQSLEVFNDYAPSGDEI